MSRIHQPSTTRSRARRLGAAAMARVLRPLTVSIRSARASQFEAVPAQEGSVVFLGDSITEGGLWHEWFPNVRVLNRGIGTETTSDIRRRLHSAIASPAAVFLLAGTNDLAAGAEQNMIVDETRRILDTITERSPGTRIYLQSVMPRAAAYRDEILSLNVQLRRLADDRPDSVEFVDLWPSLADSHGALDASLTVDSLHLNGAGYAVWTEALRPFVEAFQHDGVTAAAQHVPAAAVVGDTDPYLRSPDE